MMYKSNGGEKKKDFDRNAQTGVNIIKYLCNIIYIILYDVCV